MQWLFTTEIWRLHNTVWRRTAARWLTGSLKFYLTIQPLLVSLTSQLKIGFLDDITLSGRKDIVIKDINTITDNSDKLGLHLNAAKCEVVYGDSQATHDDDTLKNFQRVRLENVELQGVPVLSGRAINTALKQKTVKIEKAMFRLPLHQSHNALTLLRNSFAVPKLLYTSSADVGLQREHDAQIFRHTSEIAHQRGHQRVLVDTSHFFNQRWWTGNPQRRHVGTLCLLGISYRHAANPEQHPGRETRQCHRQLHRQGY